MKARTHLMRGATCLVGLTTLAAGCSSGASNTSASASRASDKTTTARATGSTPARTGSTLVVKGRHVTGLDFTVPTTAPGPSVPQSGSASTTTSVGAAAASARDAARAFLDRAVAGDFPGAWGYLASSDRARLAGPGALAEQFAAGGWTAFRVTGTDNQDVTVNVDQTSHISEIDGLVAPTATVRLPTVVENGSHFVRWTRRTVEQHFPERSSTTDAQVREAVNQWAAGRQQCTAPTNEYTNGLLGVIGLADALCRKDGAEVAGDVADLDALNEPESIIAGFGGSALSWARVVPLSGPVPMQVVAAPVAGGWTIIGLARSTSASPS